MSSTSLPGIPSSFLALPSHHRLRAVVPCLRVHAGLVRCLVSIDGPGGKFSNMDSYESDISRRPHTVRLEEDQCSTKVSLRMPVRS